MRTWQISSFLRFAAEVAAMALTSFTTWFSSPRSEVESDSSVPSSSAEEHATSDDVGVTDENQPPSPKTRFTFTPTNVKQRPRAWQRKPATPFVPRTESQKIWKRVPLQNVASNIIAAWERGGKFGDGIMRPVKKLRVAVLDGDNPENVNSTIAKWDPEVSPAKTPRRRRPKAHVDFEVHDAEVVENVGSVEAMTLCINQEGAKFTTEEGSREALSTAFGFGDSKDASFSFKLDSGEGSMNLFEASSETVQYDHQRPDDEPNYARIDGRTPIGVEEDESIPQGESIGQANEDTFPEELIAPASEPEGAPSPPDRQCLSDLPQEKDNQPMDVTLTINPDQADKAAPHSKYFNQNDHDDTSYLQAFLSRSRAQREAKSQPVQPFSPADANVALVPAELQLPSNSPVQETRTYNIPSFESLSLPIEVAEGEDGHESQDTTDAQASSPCRRSGRITRLPRPQRPTTLPNTISLRRLNGTEFIAMQKENQSLAIATRANTKRNRGSALSVRQRLLQLQAEKHPPSQ